MTVKKIDLIYCALLLVLLLTLSFYFYADTITLFPSYIHAWTQSDRLAIALRFLENNFNFFKPQTFNFATKDGITGVDFPLNEWVVAFIMKISGSTSPVIFRVYTLCYSFIGYLFLFKLTREITQSYFKSFLVVLFTFSCPIIVYYQAGFIPSSTAFSTALVAYYFYFRSIKKDSFHDLSVSVGLMTLASLIRAPFNIFLFAILLQKLYLNIKKRKFVIKEIFVFSIAYGIIILYTFYKYYLNDKYGSQFLTTILPPDSFVDFINIWSLVKERWMSQFLTIYHYIILSVTILFLIYHYIKKEYNLSPANQILLQSGLVILGSFAYFTLMAKQYVDHEYYFIDSLYPAVVLLLIGGMSLINTAGKKINTLVGILFFVLLSGGTIESKSIQKMKYTIIDQDRGEITRHNFTGSAVFLDSLRIPLNAKMLVIDAYSTNTPLILMNRRGYTVLSTTSENIEASLNLDFDYIVIQDIFLPSDVAYNYPEILNQMQRIGGNGKISLFKRSDNHPVNTINDALGIEKIDEQYRLFFDSINRAKWHKVYPDNTSNYFLRPGTLRIDKSDEFIITFNTVTNAIVYNKILFECELLANSPVSEIRAVVSVSDNHSNIYYWYFPIRVNKINTRKNYQCLFTLPDNIKTGSVLTFYLHNLKKEQIDVDDAKLTLYKK
jgi:hypothetical protein